MLNRNGSSRQRPAAPRQLPPVPEAILATRAAVTAAATKPPQTGPAHQSKLVQYGPVLTPPEWLPQGTDSVPSATLDRVVELPAESTWVPADSATGEVRLSRGALRWLRRSRPVDGAVSAELDMPISSPDSTLPAVVESAREHVAGSRVIAAPLFTPAGSNRSSRRSQVRAARQIESAARRAEMDGKKALIESEKVERKQSQYLPRNGEVGPSALRTYGRLRVQPHRATSEILGAAYPFLAEAGLGSDGLFIGQDAWSGSSFCFDPWVLYAQGVLTNPNCLLAGVVGRGKSTLAKALATRSIAFGRKVYVPGDPKGEWTVVSRSVSGPAGAIELGGGLPTRLNPLDEGPRSSAMGDAEWKLAVTSRRRDLLRAVTESALARDLRAVEATALFTALETAVSGNDVPILPQVVTAMFHPGNDVDGSTVKQLVEDGREVAHALNRLVTGDLGGLFDGPSTTRFDPSLPMVSLDLSRIQGSDQLIALVMTCSSAWMEAALTDPNGGQRWVIYDEAWRLLRQAALLARMQSQWKLSRALGIANLMVIHRLSDLDAVGEANSEARNLALGLLADCSTKIIYAQEAGEATKTATALGLSSTEAAELPGLIRGEGLWRIKERAFVVNHLCTAGELELFDTNARMTA